MYTHICICDEIFQLSVDPASFSFSPGQDCQRLTRATAERERRDYPVTGTVPPPLTQLTYSPSLTKLMSPYFFSLSLVPPTYN